LIHEGQERQMHAKEFRQSAAECERLARESTDAFVKQYLAELATEFRKQADALDEREPSRSGTVH
jgi:hypothetical protein